MIGHRGTARLPPAGTGKILVTVTVELIVQVAPARIRPSAASRGPVGNQSLVRPAAPGPGAGDHDPR
jgi:hypothetical protein